MIAQFGIAVLILEQNLEAFGPLARSIVLYRPTMLVAMIVAFQVPARVPVVVPEVVHLNVEGFAEAEMQKI